MTSSTDEISRFRTKRIWQIREEIYPTSAAYQVIRVPDLAQIDFVSSRSI